MRYKFQLEAEIREIKSQTMSMYFTISLPEQAVWRDQRSKREKGRRGGERKDGKKVSGMGGGAVFAETGQK